MRRILFVGFCLLIGLTASAASSQPDQGSSVPCEVGWTFADGRGCYWPVAGAAVFPEDERLLILSERTAGPMDCSNRADPSADNYVDYTGYALVCERGRRLSITIDGALALELRRIDERWRVVHVSE